MNIKPIRDLVIVSKEESAKVSAGGLHLVSDEGKTATGVVLAVGSGYVTENGTIVPLEVKVGDKVLFNRHSAQELTVEDKVVLALREDTLLAVVP